MNNTNYNLQASESVSEIHSESISDTAYATGGADTGTTATPYTKSKQEKKRKTVSPLQMDLSQPQKKNKAESELSDESDTDTASENSSVTSCIDMADIRHGQLTEAEGTMIGDSNVHFLSMPMNPGDIVTVASELKSIMRPEIQDLIRTEHCDFKEEIRKVVREAVTETVGELTDSFKEEIKTLRAENDALKKANSELQERVSLLEIANDDHEQYSIRNCLRIGGIPVQANEDTDDIVLDIAQQLDVDVSIAEIDRSHRVGKITKKTGISLLNLLRIGVDKSFIRCVRNSEKTPIRVCLLFLSMKT